MKEFVPWEYLRAAVQRLPTRVFSPENLQVVGIDFGPQRITDNSGVTVEPEQGAWILSQGTYLLHFGGALPDWIHEEGLTPTVLARSSNHRCGAGIGMVVAQSENPDGDLRGLLFGGDLMATYDVWNPYGIMIKESARVAQLSLTRQTTMLSPFSLLHPESVEVFTGRGVIEGEKTRVAATQKLTMTDDRWELKPNTGYLVTFAGSVALGPGEVVIPSSHTAVVSDFSKCLALLRYSCLGDPGYRGELGMLIVPVVDLKLSPDDVIATIDRCVVSKTDSTVLYNGQYQGVGADSPPMHFASLIDYGLSMVGKPLDEIVAGFSS